MYANVVCEEACVPAEPKMTDNLKSEGDMLRKLNGVLNEILHILAAEMPKEEAEMEVTCMSDAVRCVCRETEKALVKVDRIMGLL